MRHDLLTLELLLAIAQSKSITRGADQVHIALAAASKRLTDLEARLGIQLFLRKPRGVEPTAACRSLLKHVRTVREGLHAFDLEAADYSRGIRGHARVAVAQDICVEGLPHALARFAAKHPDVHVSLADMRNTEIEESVMRGDADLGLYMRPACGTTLQAWTLARGRWVAIVPSGHALQSRARVEFTDLLDFDLVGIGHSSSLMKLMGRAAGARVTRLEPRLDAASQQAVAALVEAGAGIAIVPDVVAARYAAMYQINEIPIADDWADYELVLGVARHEPKPLLVERLATAIRASMPSAAPLAKAA